jgi:hypothetical protein
MTQMTQMTQGSICYARRSATAAPSSSFSLIHSFVLYCSKLKINKLPAAELAH